VLLDVYIHPVLVHGCKCISVCWLRRLLQQWPLTHAGSVSCNTLLWNDHSLPTYEASLPPSLTDNVGDSIITTQCKHGANCRGKLHLPIWGLQARTGVGATWAKWTVKLSWLYMHKGIYLYPSGCLCLPLSNLYTLGYLPSSMGTLTINHFSQWSVYL